MNARIGRNYLYNRTPIALIGPEADLTYPFDHLGTDISVLEKLATGKHKFAKTLKKAKRPMLILGMGALNRADGQAVMALARQIAEDTGMVTDSWNGFNVLHTAASRVAGLDIGFVPGKGGKDVAAMLKAANKGEMKLVWLLGADELDMSALSDSFVIYQGHHGDAGAAAADVILPGAAYTEKDGLYVNFEGRVQMARRATFPPGEAKEDWAIIRALSERLNKTLPFDNVGAVREGLMAAAPSFQTLDEIVPAKWTKFGRAGKLSEEKVSAGLSQFHMTCAVSRSSETMAACHQAVQAGNASLAAE